MKGADYYSGADIKYPLKPKKPSSVGLKTPEEFRCHADDLERYEKDIQNYKSEVDYCNSQMAKRRSEFEVDLQKEHDLTERQTRLILEYLSESGYCDTYDKIIQVELIVDLIRSFDKE